MTPPRPTRLIDYAATLLPQLPLAEAERLMRAMAQGSASTLVVIERLARHHYLPPLPAGILPGETPAHLPAQQPAPLRIWDVRPSPSQRPLSAIA